MPTRWVSGSPGTEFSDAHICLHKMMQNFHTIYVILLCILNHPWITYNSPYSVSTGGVFLDCVIAEMMARKLIYAQHRHNCSLDIFQLCLAEFIDVKCTDMNTGLTVYQLFFIHLAIATYCSLALQPIMHSGAANMKSTHFLDILR